MTSAELPKSAKRLLILLVLSVTGGDGCARAEDNGERTMHALTFDRTSIRLDVGDTATLMLRSEPPLGGEVLVEWRAVDAAVATVTSEGIITGSGPGATRIWARLGSDSVSSIVVVEEVRTLFAQDPRTMLFDAVGDAQPLDLLPIGTRPLPQGDLSAYCTSDDESIASVRRGPSVLARGDGGTHVRCRIDDTEDSSWVEVRQRAVRVSVVRSELRPIRPDHDSLFLRLARVDRLGAQIRAPGVIWRSLNPRIVQIDERTGSARGIALGSARVVGAFHGLEDTVVISVRETLETEREPTLPPLTVVTTVPEEQPRAAPVTPAEVQPEPAALAIDDERIRAIIEGQPPVDTVAAPSALQLRVSALAAVADHRFDIGFGTEQAAGPVFGAKLAVALGGRIGLSGHGFMGTLTAQTTGTEDRDVWETGGKADYGVLPWATLDLGGFLRSYATQLGEQRWGMISVGGTAHWAALDGAVTGAASFALAPLITVSGLDSPNLGLIGAAGLDYRFGRFTAGLHYSLERYNFPEKSGVDRVEQFGLLRFIVGWILGGR